MDVVSGREIVRDYKMTTRKITSRLGMIAAMAMIAGQAAGPEGKVEPVELKQRSEEPEMSFKPEHRERGKRGGNGKGRKWWNSQR